MFVLKPLLAHCFSDGILVVPREVPVPAFHGGLIQDAIGPLGAGSSDALGTCQRRRSMGATQFSFQLPENNPFSV